jgi:hypothetical protein
VGPVSSSACKACSYACWLDLVSSLSGSKPFQAFDYHLLLLLCLLFDIDIGIIRIAIAVAIVARIAIAVAIAVASLARVISLDWRIVV